MRSTLDAIQARLEDQFSFDILTRVDADSRWLLRKQVEMLLRDEDAENDRDGG